MSETVLTKKENDILETAEDVILKKLEQYRENAENMTDKDIYNMQVLVVTLGRIRAIRDGKSYVTPPF